MEKNSSLLSKLPALLASNVSIFIYLFLFAYLVIFALVCMLIPGMSPFAPSASVQLIMGNYTNVLSALGASIAAGAGTAAHSSIKRLHKRHDALEADMATLHQKLDRIEVHTGSNEKITKS
jgi:uncharacterized RDD family membrane protein YckC